MQIDFILSSSLWVHFSLISKFICSVSSWVLKSVSWVCILLQNQRILKTFNLRCHLKNLEMHHMDSQGSSQLGIGKNHHFFFYNMLCLKMQPDKYFKIILLFLFHVLIVSIIYLHFSLFYILFSNVIGFSFCTKIFSIMK